MGVGGGSRNCRLELETSCVVRGGFFNCVGVDGGSLCIALRACHPERQWLCISSGRGTDIETLVAWLVAWLAGCLV